MKNSDLVVLLDNESAIASLIKAVVSDEPTEFAQLVSGKFQPGRTSYIHRYVLDDGSELRLKFVDTVKTVLNSKLQVISGKESFLSYLEVITAPKGKKATCKSLYVNQIVWAPQKSQALEKHTVHIEELKKIGVALGIDLNDARSWSTTYTENY